MTKAERTHKDRIAQLGCALCYRITGKDGEGTPVQLHHVREGGWGKGSYLTLIPLCYRHHMGSEGIHHLGTKLWSREFGVTQQELLKWTLDQIYTGEQKLTSTKKTS